MTEGISRFGIWLLSQISRLPYPMVKGFGLVLGNVAWLLAKPRRTIALTNLRLCFPALSDMQRERIAREHFRYFMRSFVERFIFWCAPPERIRSLASFEGYEIFEAHRGAPLILLAPHFCGLDAGGLRLQVEAGFNSMYANQKSAALNEAMTRGRSRFNDSKMFLRNLGLRAPVRGIRDGVPFYFLPDMDLGSREAVFVPFFGVNSATVTSVERLARLTGATVLPVVTTMTATGYIVKFYPPWQADASASLESCAQAMNQFIEARVLEMPAQYLWTHKRFKTRPPGEPSLY